MLTWYCEVRKVKVGGKPSNENITRGRLRNWCRSQHLSGSRGDMCCQCLATVTSLHQARSIALARDCMRTRRTFRQQSRSVVVVISKSPRPPLYILLTLAIVSYSVPLILPNPPRYRLPIRTFTRTPASPPPSPSEECVVQSRPNNQTYTIWRLVSALRR